MQYDQLFWLHIKKSAGITTRSLLQPYYVKVDKTKRPKTFIQASPEEYNDILNNYRVVLGEYQFKRCLFAKKYLYPNNWDNIYSFAFSRNPIDRCISMFFYLFWRDVAFTGKFVNLPEITEKKKKLLLNTEYAFDTFLDYAHQAQHSDSIYQPLGNHFTTHTAPMWDDITDIDGNILLKQIFRLEALTTGINTAFSQCGIDRKLDEQNIYENVNRGREKYIPTNDQIRKIENIYLRDFEIYESAEH